MDIADFSRIGDWRLAVRRNFTATGRIMKAADLVRLLNKPLPGSGVIQARAGEWRQRIDGTWRFWLDAESVEERPRVVPAFVAMPATAAAELGGVAHLRSVKPRSAQGRQ